MMATPKRHLYLTAEHTSQTYVGNTLQVYSPGGPADLHAARRQEGSEQLHHCPPYKQARTTHGRQQTHTNYSITNNGLEDHKPVLDPKSY